jgi:hypothetical protein
MIKAIIAFTIAATANAACDNGCSGHGTCGIDDVCDCYDNFGVGLGMESGDCSDRICPFEIAWVDNPHIFNADAKNFQQFHYYAECAGRGICNRGSGLCECFDGYEGQACHRTSCPNQCSGHGTCEYIEDLGYAATWNDYTTIDFSDDKRTFGYQGWDIGKERACVCDAQYTDVDCSKRMCPYGTDALAVREDILVQDRFHRQQIVFKALNDDLTSLAGKTFALTFVSKLNETFTTIPIVFDAADSTSMSDMANDIRLALLHLPNKVIDDVMVSAKSASNGFGTVANTKNAVIVTVTFSGDAVQGPQHLLVVEDYECSSGCTPRITGLGLQTVTAPTSEIGVVFADTTLNGGYTKLGGAASAIVDGVAGPSYDATPSSLRLPLQQAYENSYECGRRGKCDYSTGLCECFEGYSGENCIYQTILV